MANPQPKNLGAKKATEDRVKVFGKPLQVLYGQLTQIKNAPEQPSLIREICDRLDEVGVHYHPRTVKRQLLGNIEYIPQSLEKILTEWVQEQSQASYKKLLRDFKRDKTELEVSSDQSLYVSPQFFTKMTGGYLYLKKNLSRRKLALQLQKSLLGKKIKIGLETLQAALAGKTQKIRKVLEDELIELFLQEGFKSKKDIEAFLKQAEKEGKTEIEKVEVGNIEKLIDAYLLKSEGVSKRKLALKIKARLEEKGYIYHLSSIQSVIEGKTKKTRKAILETLFDLFQEVGMGGPESAKKFVDSLPEEHRHWHHYASAEQIPQQVQELIDENPGLTRRRLATLLREDLLERHFDFSLNTLQYILAGKTKRTRQIVLEILNKYRKGDALKNSLTQAGQAAFVRKGRPSVGTRVLFAFEQLQQSIPEDREVLRQKFMEARSALIRYRWTRKFKKRTAVRGSRKKIIKDLYQEIDSQDSFLKSDQPTERPEVSFDAETTIHRLVS